MYWQLWRETPEMLLLPGHDLSIRLDDHGRPDKLGERRAVIAARLTEGLSLTTPIDLTEGHP